MSVALVLTLALAVPQDLAAYEPPPAGSFALLRDDYGVPHVIAADERSLFFGAGYAQAQDQLAQLSRNYRRAAGRLAEVVGRSALHGDRMARALRLRERAAAGMADLDASTRAQLEAFAAGINRNIEERRDAIPSWIEPVAATDVLAFAVYVDMMFTVWQAEGELRAAGPGARRVVVAPRASPAGFGSNQFAVAPSRSASGGAMLSMDPHLPLSGVTLWYEMHLVGPGVNAMGAMFPGMPFIGMGRTARHAWCMTVNGADLSDVFVFAVDPDDPRRYLGPGGPVEFEVSEERFGVRSDEDAVVPMRQTAVGPVVAVGDGVVYALALPWADSLRSVRELWDMACARDLAEFRRALEPLGLSMFNILYADAGGHLFYVSNQRVPVRDQRIDASALRPGGEAWAQWRGYHAFADLPQITDPAAGFLLNTNSGPQNACPRSPVKRGEFPPYMIGHDQNERSRRLLHLLRRDGSVTWDAMHAYATDTYLSAADRWVPMAVRLIEQFADDHEADREILQETARVLSAWDRRADVDSRGAALFGYLSMDPDVGRAVLREALPAELLPAVARSARAFVERFDSLDAPWGAISRIRHGAVELPCAGHAAPGMSALRPTGGAVARDGRRYAASGSSYGMIVDFAGRTRSSSCLPFGISEDPASPHYADQMTLYARGQHKPAWFLPDELAKHTESRRVLRADR